MLQAIQGYEYKYTTCVVQTKKSCPDNWSKTKFGDRLLCYKDFGLHLLGDAESLCTQESAWLLVPEDENENSGFISLLKNHNLLGDSGAALGLRKKDGKFVDRNDQEPTYRRGLNISISGCISLHFSL